MHCKARVHKPLQARQCSVVDRAKLFMRSTVALPAVHRRALLKSWRCVPHVPCGV